MHKSENDEKNKLRQENHQLIQEIKENQNERIKLYQEIKRECRRLIIQCIIALIGIGLVIILLSTIKFSHMDLVIIIAGCLAIIIVVIGCSVSILVIYARKWIPYTNEERELLNELKLGK